MEPPRVVAAELHGATANSPAATFAAAHLLRDSTATSATLSRLLFITAGTMIKVFARG
jgi:hypothetical protein